MIVWNALHWKAEEPVENTCERKVLRYLFVHATLIPKHNSLTHINAVFTVYNSYAKRCVSYSFHVIESCF